MNTAKTFTDTADTNPHRIGYQQLLDTISTLSTEAAEMSRRATGLDPEDKHDMTVFEYCEKLLEEGRIFVSKGDRIRLGQAAAMQAKLAGREKTFRVTRIETPCGLRKDVPLQVHARASLDRAARAIGIVA